MSLSVCDASPDVFVHMHLRYKCTRGPNRVRIRHVLAHVQMLTNDFACVVRIKEAPDKMMMAKALQQDTENNPDKEKRLQQNYSKFAAMLALAATVLI